MRWLSLCLAVLVLPQLARAEDLRGDYSARCPDRAPQRRMPRSIRKVDFCNLTYGTFDLRGGTYEKHLYRSIGGLHDTISWRLLDVVYGDFDGDGADEAAIVLGNAMVHNTEAKADITSSISITLYRLTDGKLVEIGSIGADGKVSKIGFGKGYLVVISGEDAGQSKRRWVLGKEGFEDRSVR